MKISKIIIIFVFISNLCFGIANGPYMGQEPPGMIPKIFAPGIISLPGRFERAPNFYMNGKEFYFTIIEPDFSNQEIFFSTCDDKGEWSALEEIIFSRSLRTTADVSLTSDGSKLCFTSNHGKSDFWDNDIWISEREGDWWSEPTKLSSRFNSSQGEWGACILNNGTVYFGRSITSTNSDLYYSRLINGAYEAPRTVQGVNTGVFEWDPFVDENETYMIFKSNRPGGYGATDLYISFKSDPEGSWTTPMNLGPIMNTSIQDDCGSVTPDGKYYMFARRDGNQEMDVYWVDVGAILPDPNGPIQNLTTGQTFGSIQCAVNYALPGEIIEIGPGSYEESVIIDKDIVVKSIDPNDSFYVGGTIISGDLEGSVFTLSDNSSACRIAGLTIRAGEIGISGSHTNVEIFNCRIMDNLKYGIKLTQESKPHLLNCLITANGQTGIIMLPGSGRGNPPCEPIIENCIIVNNGQASITGGEPVIVNSLIEGQ